MMILVSAGRNSAKYLQEWNESILRQSYRDFRQLVIDDGSMDESADLLRAMPIQGELVLRDVEDRRWGLYNKSVVILEEMAPDDGDVIVSLDQDDLLLTACTLGRIAKIFEDPNVWLSYGGITPCNVGNWDGRKVAGPMDWDRPPRKQPWKATSIRAWRWFLMKNILKKDLQNGDGSWLKFPEDRIVTYPMLEMAGEEHVHRYSGPAIYGYRDFAPQSDAIVNAEAVQDTLEALLVAEPYQLKTEEELRDHACDWL